MARGLLLILVAMVVSGCALLQAVDGPLVPDAGSDGAWPVASPPGEVAAPGG